MPFIEANFSPVGANSAKGQVPSQFSYKNINDSKNVMLSAGYFNEAALQLNTNDMMTIVSSDGLGFLHVVSSDPVAKIVQVDDDLVVTATSGLFQKVVHVFGTSNLTIVASDNGTLFRVDKSGGNVNITLADTADLVDDIRVGIMPVTNDDNVVNVKRAGTDIINGSPDDIVLGTQYKLTTFVGDVSDSEYVADLPVIEQSRTFEVIHKLSEFPTPIGGATPLKNGVNYQVYIDGPISSDLRFSLPTDYSLGGSLIYMGTRGVLKWTQTNSNALFAWLEGDSTVGMGQFELNGFDVTDEDKVAKAGISIAGDTIISRGKISINNCLFQDYKIGGDFSFFNRLELTQADFLPALNNTIKLNTIKNVVAERCRWETESATLPVLSFAGDGVREVSLDRVNFTIPGSHPGAIDLGPHAQFFSSLIFFTIDDCKAVNTNGFGPGFITPNSGSIASIKNDGGNIEVTTYVPHGLSINDTPVQLWGTLDYDGGDAEVQSVASTTKFTLDIAYTTDNHSGYFLLGSINEYSLPRLTVRNSNGFERVSGANNIQIHNSSVSQAVATINVFQPIAVAAGDLLQSRNGLAKDIFLSSLTEVNLTNTSLETVSAVVGMDFVINPALSGSSPEEIELRFEVDSDSNRQSTGFYFEKESAAEPVDAGYSFSEIMRIGPGETVRPMVAPRSNPITASVFQSLSFHVKIL